MAQAATPRLAFSAGSIRQYQQAFKRHHPNQKQPTFQHIGYDKVVPVHPILDEEELDSISEGFANTA